MLQRDRRALDVPAGAAAARTGCPRTARPSRSPRQTHAVERVLLARRGRGRRRARRRARSIVVAVAAGHLAERRVGGHREVEVVLDAVDRAGGLQPLDQLDHQRDRLDGADVVRRAGAPAAPAMSCAEQLGLALGELDPVDVHLRGPLEQRVVDVGDVLDVGDLVAGVAPGPVEQVEGDVRRGVAEVGGVVRRDAADVEPGRAVGRGRDQRARWRCRGRATGGPGARAGSGISGSGQARMAGSLVGRAAQNGGHGMAGHSPARRRAAPPRVEQPPAAPVERRRSRGRCRCRRARRPRSPPSAVAHARATAGHLLVGAAARRASPRGRCAACARRGSVTPWSTPYRWPSAISSTWPPLRSALLTSTSKTAIRRSGSVSSWTSDTGRSWPSTPSKTCSQPVGHLALARPGSTASCSGSGSCQQLDHARAVRPVAAARSAARRPSRAPRRRRTPRPRGRRACRRGSPTAAAPPRSACRRRWTPSISPRKVALDAGMIRPWRTSSPVEQVDGPLDGSRVPAAEAVGAHAEVAVGVDRVAAERAARAGRRSSTCSARLTNARARAGGDPDQEHLVGLGLLEAPRRPGRG